MGCDIHMILAKKSKNTYKCIKQFDLYRQYRLFGLLAGVRDVSVEPIVAPRGILSGAPQEWYSGAPELDLWQEEDTIWLGDHSFSYLTLEDFINYKKYGQYMLDSEGDWTQLKELIFELVVNKNSILVFGFDS